MISLCTVMLKRLEPFCDVLFQSLKRTKHITEVLIALAEADEDFYEERQEGHILFKRFGWPTPEAWKVPWGHALGLHACIERATTEYLMFCDPDVFFYTPIDELYLDLMHEHNLNVIGVSHHAAVNQRFSFFPCVMNMLLKRKELPGPDFLKGSLKLRNTLKLEDTDMPEDRLNSVDGKYLAVGPIKEYAARFPNQQYGALFDVGCNLCLWAQDNNWRWMSFQTLDCHLYTTRYYKSNPRMKLKLKDQKLIFHATSASLGSNGDLFRKAFEDQND